MQRVGGWGAAAAALLMLAGCAPSSPLATPEADADGKNFEAKPGMGRLYIVHGDLIRGGSSHTPYTGGGPAAAFLVGLFGGAGSGAAGKGNFVTGTYYLGDHPLGVLGSGHYMVLDLPPGEYELRFRHGEFERSPAAIRLWIEDGLVTYRKSMFDTTIMWGPGGQIQSCYAVECQARIREGQRVVADWPPKAPIGAKP